MKALTTVFVSLFLFGFSMAQEDTQHYNTIAGDSAFILSNKVLSKSVIGSFVTISLDRAIHRIVFIKGVEVGEDFDLQIINPSGQNVDFLDHGNSIDIIVDSAANYQFKVTTNQHIKEDIIGRFFWVYNNNIRMKAPILDLADIDGNTYSNSNLLGKIVVFNFWGIQCKPCRKEIPQLNKLVQKYSGRDDIVFLAISSDSNKELRKFNKKVEFDYTLIHKENSTGFALEMSRGNWYALPTHVILDQKGDVIFYYLGGHPEIEDILGFCIDKIK